jgi:hypothetical protein
MQTRQINRVMGLFIWRVPMKGEFAFIEAEFAEKNGI